MLTIEMLKLDYGKFRMNIEDLSFGKGLHAVLGPNGSGKSSLMRAILGYSDDSIKMRDIYYRGSKVGTTHQFLSYLPQDSPVFRITADEYINMTADHQNEDLYQSLIETFELENFTDRTIEVLSGGEFKRVQCAQIAMEQKNIMMLDEVEQGLDLKYQHQILKWMKAEADKKTIIANMHDAALAMTYADTVTMIKDGRVIASGIGPDRVTSEMLSDCYSIPLTIERRKDSFVVFHNTL